MKRRALTSRRRARRARRTRAQRGGSRAAMMERVAALEAAVAELKGMIPNYCDEHQLPYAAAELEEVERESMGPTTLYKVTAKNGTPYYMMREDTLYQRGPDILETGEEEMGPKRGYLRYNGSVHPPDDE